MEFRGDERGQPVLIGAILLFAMIVLAFATYQGAVVPSQNAEVEYNHFQVVEGQFSDLRTSATNAIGSGEQRSVTISLGTRYPARLIALNPSAPSGSLETTGEGEVEIEGLNVTAADVCATDANEVTSRSLRYQPSYHEHRSAESITYENTFRARSFRSGEIQFDGQSLVQPGGDGEATRINLLLLTGSFSRSSGESFDLDLNPTHRYGVDVTSNDSFNVTVPSQFSATDWENQILDDVDQVEYVVTAGDRSTIVFASGDYRVSCATLGLNSQPAYEPQGGAKGEPVFDTRWIEADGEPVQDEVTGVPGDSLELTMEAVDRESGTGINGATVNFSIEAGVEPDVVDITDQDSATTDGEATVTLDVKENTGGETFDVYGVAGDDADSVTVRITDAGVADPDVSNLTEGEGDQTQMFSFTAEGDYEEGFEVVIDLREVEGNDANSVDYGEANVMADNAEFTTNESGNDEITYTATGQETDGDRIELEVAGVKAGSNSEGRYPVPFTGPNGETVEAEFWVE